MEKENYFYLCSNELLKLMGQLTKKDVRLSSIIDEYSNNFTNNNVNVCWSLISTSLLMSERFSGTNNPYQQIGEKSLVMIKNLLERCETVIPGFDHISSSCLLNSDNTSASSFNIIDNTDYSSFDYNYDTEELTYEDLLEIKKLEASCNTYKEGVFGCNESIIEDNKINIIKLINYTRNSLAHSNFELISDNIIRLYHYNKSSNKYDFNVALDKSIVLVIVDELNEFMINKKINFLKDYDWPSADIIYSKDKLKDEDFINHLLSFGILDEEECRQVLLTVKQNEEFYDENEEHDNFDRFVLLYDEIFHRLEPVCDFGLIVNDLVYGSKAEDMDNAYYSKLDYYEYYNNKLLNNYKEDEFRLFLLSFINGTLLNTYSSQAEKKIIGFDNNNFEINDHMMNTFSKEHQKKNEVLKKELQEQIISISKSISKIDNLINKKNKILSENKSINNDYYKKVLPNEIESLRNQKNENFEKYNIALQTIADINKLGINYNYDLNLSEFILRHLRNSLAHGNTLLDGNLDLDNIYDAKICFDDYDPDNKLKLTFRGIIKIGDLLKILTNKDNVKTLFNLESNDSVIKTKESK